MPFIMIVVTTSWAPVFTFRIAGTAAHTAPPSMPNKSTVSTSRGAGRDVNVSAANDAVAMPTMNCPSTPMLNIPPLKHTDTASAEKISGPALASTYPNPFLSPNEPFTIAPYTVIGFSP